MANRLNANSPKFYPSECIFLALSFFVVNWKTIFPEGIANIHSDRTSKKLMYDVVIALIPAFLVSLYVFDNGVDCFKGRYQ